MIIRGLVFVEGIRCEIQHPIVQRLVLKDLFIGRCHLLRRIADALLHKHVIVEIALVHLPHIDQAEQGYGSDHPFGLQLPRLEEQEAEGSYQNDPERAPTIGHKDSLTHFDEVAYHGVIIFRRQLFQGL